MTAQNLSDKYLLNGSPYIKETDVPVSFLVYRKMPVLSSLPESLVLPCIVIMIIIKEYEFENREKK